MKMVPVLWRGMSVKNSSPKHIGHQNVRSWYSHMYVVNVCGQ